MDDKTSPQQLNNSLTNVEWARTLATDDSTDPELLRELALKSDRATRKAVVANPNTLLMCC